MPTPIRGPRLGGSASHQRLMLANLATSLFEHGRITTTETKAKRLRPLAEKLVTFAKRGDLHARRQVMSTIRDKDVVHRLFAEIGPRFAERPGGYTRIVKVGPRKGDNAPMAVIELVESLTVGQQAVGEAERARGSRFARDRRPATAAAATGGSTVAAALDPVVSGDALVPDEAVVDSDDAVVDEVVGDDSVVDDSVVDDGHLVLTDEVPATTEVVATDDSTAGATAAGADEDTKA